MCDVETGPWFNSVTKSESHKVVIEISIIFIGVIQTSERVDSYSL